jgi:excisionase family DNA binding protein
MQLPLVVSAKYNNERLLNTAEAARFLRVSQASIRRWTDAGLLPARRVGRRRERRFVEADLLAFMERSAPHAAGPTGTVNVARVTAGVPVHLATLYGSDAAGLRASVPFLTEGVRLGQPCFLVALGKVLERYAQAIDLDNGIQAMRFKGNTTSEVLTEWEEIFARALAKGPTVIRIVGEMSAVRSMFVSVTEMLAFEEALELVLKRYPVAAVCQYDAREFDGVAVLRALKAHPDIFNFRTGAFLN